MSIALFRDTVTLYLLSSDGESPARRVIRSVKTTVAHSQQEGAVATVYLPLWGKRSLVYQDPESWDGKAHSYTLRPGDRLVCRESNGTEIPEEALTVRRVICRRSGSRRLWHLEIYATTVEKEVMTYDGTDT